MRCNYTCEFPPPPFFFSEGYNFHKFHNAFHKFRHALGLSYSSAPGAYIWDSDILGQWYLEQ